MKAAETESEKLLKLFEHRIKMISIAAKDHLTEDEAAFYCGLSLSQFRKIKAKYGIMPGYFGGKKQYRKADLYRAKESGFNNLEVPR